MPKMVRVVVEDSLTDSHLEDQRNDIFKDVVNELVPLISMEALNEEIDRHERQELELDGFNEYLDRCIMEAMIEDLAEEYSQKEEKQTHIEQLTDKKKRVSFILFLNSDRMITP